MSNDDVSIAATKAVNRIAERVEMTPEVRDDVYGIIQEEFSDMAMDLWEANRATATAIEMTNMIGNEWKDRATRAEARIAFLETAPPNSAGQSQ